MSMSLEDAKRIAAIFEADDIISVPARACRVLANRVAELEAAQLLKENQNDQQ